MLVANVPRGQVKRFILRGIDMLDLGSSRDMTAVTINGTTWEVFGDIHTNPATSKDAGEVGGEEADVGIASAMRSPQTRSDASSRGK